MTEEGGNYRKELNRLTSFDRRPRRTLDYWDLAAAGFYWAEEQFNVKCFSCQFSTPYWIPGDDPIERHRELAPDCPFVKGEPCGNIRIGENETDTPTQPRGSLEEPDLSADPDPVNFITDLVIPLVVNENAQTVNSVATSRSPPTPNPPVTEVIKKKNPIHEQYIMHDARLETFKHWPESAMQPPDRLAEAGFFYVQLEDGTLCYWCGGGLKDWEPNDEPWVEHALNFPGCGYVRRVKGDSFISQVRIQALETCGKAKLDEEIIVEANSDPFLCQLCCKNKINIVILPCGHITTCTDCANKLDRCSICRKFISYRVRAFFA